MNLNLFFKKNNLGSIITFEKLNGGLVNQVYKVTSDKNIYVLKIINKININKINYEEKETIANFINNNGINCICAIKINNHYINKFNNNYYIVYPYFEGYTINEEDITEKHLIKIAALTSKLHQLKYYSLKIDKTPSYYSEIFDFEKYIYIDSFNKMPFKKLYLNNYKKIQNIQEKINNAYNKSYTRNTLCHKDIKISNVLWKDENPYLIDFETCGVWNANREFINTMIEWTNSLSNFNEKKIEIFMTEYLKENKLKCNIQDAILGALRGKVAWLKFNLDRCIIYKESNDEIKIAINQVILTIHQINKYLKIKNKIKKIYLNLYNT